MSPWCCDIIQCFKDIKGWWFQYAYKIRSTSLKPKKNYINYFNKSFTQWSQAAWWKGRHDGLWEDQDLIGKNLHFFFPPFWWMVRNSWRTKECITIYTGCIQQPLKILQLKIQKKNAIQERRIYRFIQLNQLISSSKRNK